MKLIRAHNNTGVGSHPTVMGFDGSKCRSLQEMESIEDSMLQFTKGIPLHEYIDQIKKPYHWWERILPFSRQARINALKEKLHEKGGNYFFTGNNMNVDVGLNFIAKLMTNKATIGWTHMNVGTDASDTTPGMTDLVTPLTPRLPLSGRHDVFNYAYHRCYYGLTDGNGSGTALWREVAPFTALTGGIMLGRFVIPEFSKDEFKSANIVYSTRLAAEAD